MADGRVGISQSGAPDRQIDNSLQTQDDGTQVWRQRMEDPEGMALIRVLEMLVHALGLAVDPSGRLRVNVDPIGGAQSVPVTGPVTSAQTLSGLTTLTSLNTLGSTSTGIAGVPALNLYNQFAMQQRAYGISVV
jgi:hypothetical protein